jgi:ElaB/YqjD/DUF883 family membrane-anchored ribosome-binding protein
MNETQNRTSEASVRKLMDDFKVVYQDAEALARVTAGDLGDKVREARARLATSLEKARHSFDHLQEQAIEKAKEADKVIRAHPYESVGVAFGFGILLGVVLGRR